MRLNERKWLTTCDLSVQINPLHFSMPALKFKNKTKLNKTLTHPRVKNMAR